MEKLVARTLRGLRDQRLREGEKGPRVKTGILSSLFFGFFFGGGALSSPGPLSKTPEPRRGRPTNCT